MTLAMGGLMAWTQAVFGQAHNLMSLTGGQARPGAVSGASSTSQTSTAATAVTAQSLQAAVTSLQAQAALSKSLAAYQSLRSAQAASQLSAQASSAVNLMDLQHNIINGLTSGGASLGSPGGLSPTGTLVPTSSQIQQVDLSGGSGNQLALSKGGSVTLPDGTTGSDQVTVSGAGSVTTTVGAVSATAGSLTTPTGGPLAATDGGTIALTAGSATLKTSTGATISSSVAGSFTYNGSSYALAANTPTVVPAGAKVTFSGSSAATVTVAGAGTVQLTGAGTLSLANPVAGAGGTITTNSGTTGFTSSAVISSQAAGATVTFTGSGSIAFSSKGSDTLPVIVQPNLVTDTTPAFTTTGDVLATQGYTVPTSWSGIQALSQSYDAATGKWVDTITQKDQEALLYWQTFNIGKNTTLDFDQSQGGASVGDWVAINRILDPSLSPSQIFGSIQASGQVYVINQNGIIFNGSSQVNAHALVASTLPINTNALSSGLLNNPDMQYQFSSVAIPVGQSTPAYDPNNDVSTLANGQTQANTLPNVASGAIVVDQGASLYSPGSGTGVGGKIALVAPTVSNFGDISSPDGQIILAAGEQVGFVAHPSTDASLRGLDVAIGQANAGDTVTNGGTVDQGGSAASNQPVGLIEAPEADVTIAAPNIKQDGIIESQTSVALNGRIDLLAISGLSGDVPNAIFDAQQGSGAVGGSISLGQNSLTEIVPDYASTDTQVGSYLSLPSQLYIEGSSFEMTSGSQMIAPNATVTFGLGILNEAIAKTPGETSTPLAEDVGSYASSTTGSPIISNNYLSTQGQISLDSGAYLDVSGSSDVQASVAENVVAAQLTDAVLENSPLQKDGSLHGQTVYVDVSQTGTNADGSTWVGSPIGDFSGYANLVEHSVGELTVAGGSVALNTNGQVNLQSNSTINVSGGSVNYAGATVPTTYLLGANGNVVNIAQASPTQSYAGIYNGSSLTSAKWGVNQTYNSGPLGGTVNEAGYVEGGNAGSLSIEAPSVSVAGSLYGNTTTGSRQQSSPPKAGTFSLNIEAQSSTPSNPPVVNIVIQPSSDPASSTPNTIDLSQDLFGIDGFGNATINTGSGKITVASDANISTEAGSAFSLVAANIEIDGQILDPSGSIALTALTQQPTDISAGNATPYNSALGNISLGSGSSVLATGLTFDEMSNASPGTLPFSVNGGSVSLNGAVIDQASGSSIDASGGLARSSAGTVYSGKGGSISLTAYFGNSSGQAAGSMVLDGSLTAYGIGTGGSLSLKTLAVAVGNASPGNLVNGVSPLVLPANFFGQGGFSNYSVVGAAGVQIENGAVLNPVLTEEVADLGQSQFGINLISSSELSSYPTAPVNLSFSAPGATNFNDVSQITLGTNASITLPAASSLSLTGQLVDIQGSAIVPGGNITIKGASTSALPGYLPGVFTPPAVTVYLEDGSSLSVSGETITGPLHAGSNFYNTGEVLSGGSIAITGNIVGASSASLSANGTVGTIDVPTSSTTAAQQSQNMQLKLSAYTPETIASNGGSISLNGDEMLYYEGSLSAKAGNATATGGSFTLESGLAATYTQPPQAGYPDIFIEQNGNINVGSVTLGQSLTGGSQTGGAYIGVDQFAKGGFGSLIFDGNVEFEGGSASNPITISASKEVLLNLSSASASLFADGSSESVVITAPYIAIGAPTLSISQQSVTADAPIYNPVQGSGLEATPTLGVADPTYGDAKLTLNATDLIDVTFLSLQNFGTTNFNVSAGDIRGGGLFYGAGNITLNAGQVYTPTGATFTVAAFGSDNSVNGGTVKIENLSGVSRPLPYSAGGTINIFATNITQDGNLEAPFGTINLGAGTGQSAVLPDVIQTQNLSTLEYYDVADPSQYAPQTTNLVLGSKSITSVSGVANGETLVLPYGTIENGTEWIAPNGSDITAGGLIGKGVNLQANTIDDASGSVINIAGGGELFAYQFNPGVGGTNDILSVYKYANGSIEVNSSSQPINSTSFAIVPTYDLNYAPIDLTVDSTGATPYANSALTGNIGNEIYLYGGDGITAGSYAILPARYALLPSAYLVTPEGASASQAAKNPDGSLSIAGYIYNSLNVGQQLVPSVAEFQLESNAVVNADAPYEISSAASFLAASAASNHVAVPRLPGDAGQVVFDAAQGLDLQGTLIGQAASGGLGSVVDIGSSDDIYIVDNSTATPTLVIPSGETQADYQYLTLSAQELDQFGAGSLLIGGVRSTTSSGTSINTLTSNIYVQNDSSGSLSGSEIILDSKGTISVAAGASIQQTGGASSNEQNLTVGSASIPGSGDGTLLRVGGDASAGFTRLGVDAADSNPDLTIGAGASISGVAVTLDSSSGASINSQANIDGSGGGQSLTLSAGAVSLQIDPNASVSGAPGLVLQSGILQTLEGSVKNFVISSYSSVNFYGAGTLGALDAKGNPVIQNLMIQSGGIYGYAAGGGAVTINAANVTLENTNGVTLSGSAPTSVGSGSLAINANTITLGANSFAVDGYSSVQLTANNGILASGTGALNAQGSLNLAAPIVTASSGANYSFNALGGAVGLTAVTGTASVSGGLGATIGFNGSSVALDSEVYAPSGIINAKASSGDIDVQSQANLDAAGEAIVFGSATGYTSGGEVNLTSTGGNISIDPNSGKSASINVSALAGAGNAGSVSLSAADGEISIANNTLNGSAGKNGTAGTFNATVGGNGQNLALSGLTTPVIAGGFTTMSFDVVNSALVTVDGAVGPATGNGISSFTLTAENGGITVDNTINASGVTGGTINLYASGGVTLTGNAVLNVNGAQYNDAGEGGTIDIETEGANGGALNIAAGVMDLGVGTGSSMTAAGTVHLRAPLLTGALGSGGATILPTEDPDSASNNDAAPGGIAIASIDPSKINNAGTVVVEGYRVYDPSSGTIDAAVQSTVAADVANFPTAALATQLGVSTNALFQIQPGVEIINPNANVNGGNLTLGTVVTSGQADYWDLSGVRTAAGAAGILTLRAANSLVFNGSLTDGFAYNANDAENAQNSPYTWDLLTTGNGESWTYRLVAGAAFNSSAASTANYGEVVAQGAPATGSLANGSLELGLTIPQGFNYGTKTATTADTYAELIRTGTGNITIDTGGSVVLLNQMATIYTAGQLAPTLAGFSSPTGNSDTKYERKVYGGTLSPAPQYTAQYTENGGNIVINALQDIDHETMVAGQYVADTSWQLPTNWLYRRGATSSAGVFDVDPVNKTETASTTWWIDFSNFFEGVGALGGGNVSLNAGNNIINVDAVVPTNARMPVTNASGTPIADVASNLVELGGGDLSVVAGGTIEGGTYYVEKGTGSINASTISSAGDTARISPYDASLGQNVPLAMTLFLGNSSFSVNATNAVTIGSTVNPFLLPQGVNNGFNDKTLFSTYGSQSTVGVSSLLGTVTIQGSQYSGNGSSAQLPGGLADAYYSDASPNTLSRSTELSFTGTPWTLTLDPQVSGSGLFDSVLEYHNFYNYSPPVFQATAFTGNINYLSDQTLAASPYGTLSLLAGGTVEGAFNSASAGNGLTATISVLDNNPALFPGLTNPLGLGASTPEPFSYPSLTNLIPGVYNSIGEAPSYSNVSYTNTESQHTRGLLHDNATTPPVQIETISGNIEDFTLISPEETTISSGLDLQDVSLYIQNNNASDISIVSANRDITLYDPTSSGLLSLGDAGSTGAAYGDVQISGPGTLEVLAGGNLNLGQGVSEFADSFPGTNQGITSIGNSRDPYLPFGGAEIIAAAGLGDTSGLASNPTQVAFQKFEDAYLNDPSGTESSIYLPDLGSIMGLSGATDSQIWDIFSGTPDATLTASELQIQSSLTPEGRNALATTIFYDVIRDAGRNHNSPSSPDFGSYASGYDAIKTLFPNAGNYQGDITLTSREFKTTNGGDINLLAPGGGINVGLNNLGTQAVDQGILTVDGGNISIFTNNDVSIGTSRIFTLHGGNIIIWSSQGNIDAGAASRTVQSAPPTQVLVDSQSANVQTDLAGLATGGGIGVLETVVGAPPGDVDLIAPVGTVNAGDAGIRASGNINVAAAQVLNANNIQAGGSKSGVPTTTSANVGLAVSAANAAGSSENAASNAANQQQNNSSQQQDLPSIISVEVVGYGDDGDSASTESPSDRKSSGATYLAARPDSGASKF
jgi:filamentous hemagglutinin family protein